VLAHDYPSVLKFMDKKYIDVQMDKKNDKEGKRFIDEFFGGYQDPENRTGYTNMVLTDVTFIDVYELTQTGENEYKVVFKVGSLAGIFIYNHCQLIIRGNKMGFYGAVG
jgi:hypothetical protein